MKTQNYLIAILFAFLLGGCSQANIDDKTIVIGASSTPHALILEETREFIESRNYALDIIVMADYVTPNLALDSGDIDANYFQHEPYLTDFNANNGTDLVSVVKVHFEPLGIYGGKKTTIDNIQTSDTVIVPNDTSNKARALDLLTIHGLTNCNIIEMEAQAIPSALQDAEYAVINGNYALSSGVVDKVIITESPTSDIAQVMGNIIAVKRGNEHKPAIELLVEAITQENIRDFIEATFGASVIPLF
ncbi:MAG TPA: MetQ/NlpA family ABC transporter substrate-binding protein [Paludibacteraceae bacterium]|nr:MetQ/NlpA family ABC transporter substrate-binding protein [Paludibacteraceae bacterium]